MPKDDDNEMDAGCVLDYAMGAKRRWVRVLAPPR